jgi:N-acyl-D-aspartate/D-glutamate deacylase
VNAQRTLLAHGTFFDGLGGEGLPRDVLIEGDRILRITAHGAMDDVEAERIDVHGQWVMPGFIDLHTHYDAEVELLPGLSESVRHGITTCIVGSCGLSMVEGDPVDLADMFCRVEGIPRSIVKPLLEKTKNWEGPREYFTHLDTLPLGPNIAALLGHSAIRAKTMGLKRALTKGVKPSEAELARMEKTLNEALDEGFLGLSINTLTWDKMDGDDDDLRSRPTPSVFATWSEYRRLIRTLRKRSAILQGVPNVSTKVNVLLFFLESIGILRPGLKTMLISMIDAKASRLPFMAAGVLCQVTKLLGADVRFQSLPNEFDLWIDGMEAPVFEEFGAGTSFLHQRTREERDALLRDPAFRRRFRRDWAAGILGRAFHRDLNDTNVLACEAEPSLVGQSFGAIARARNQDPLDTFLDLVAKHGEALRWYTVLGNDRPAWLAWIVKHPAALIGFSDAGAHLRNMAHYNFPLRLLRLVREAEKSGKPVMTMGRAVERLTSEISRWLGLDAGVLAEGKRADLVVVNPAGLTAAVGEIHEEEMPGFDGLKRLVRRNDSAVPLVMIGGRVAVREGLPVAALGSEKMGRVLRVEQAR